ncbi:M23 family metallopeptidase [Kineococcus sp. NUM-3379]
MKRSPTTVLVLVLTLLAGTVSAVAVAPSAQAAPLFQLPFPCSQTWHGNSSRSSAHRSHEIDFNRGSSATADLGDTVVAAAGGRVRSAGYQTGNGYGNLVTLDHGGGWVTYYAHLKTMAVKTGERVLAGQAIGALGKTSAKNPGITPHLHYEVRASGVIQKATFAGSTFRYPDASVRSGNCATRQDPQELCGEGFEQIDSRALGSLGTVNLGWKASTRQNCVTTLKFTGTGTRSFARAYLKPAGSGAVEQRGDVLTHAGPVRAKAPSCVVWGGTIGSTAWTSPSEHC